jgi:hypothetical protein
VKESEGWERRRRRKCEEEKRKGAAGRERKGDDRSKLGTTITAHKTAE